MLLGSFFLHNNSFDYSSDFFVPWNIDVRGGVFSLQNGCVSGDSFVAGGDGNTASSSATTAVLFAGKGKRFSSK
jgi:hypothetical protein